MLELKTERAGIFTAELLCLLRRPDEPQKWRNSCHHHHHHHHHLHHHLHHYHYRAQTTTARTAVNGQWNSAWILSNFIEFVQRRKICQMKYNDYLNFPVIFELKKFVFVCFNFKLASFTL